MSAIVKSLERTLYNSLTHYAMRTDSQSVSVLIAYSGGPDSTVLLAASAGLLAKRSIVHAVGAVYVSHGLRSKAEQESEETIVRDVTEKLQIPVTIIRCAPGEIEEMASSRGKGIEEAARAKRYAALRDVQQGSGHDVIMTAHTADDQIETMIMRMFQGSGISGLGGIRYQDDGILRPLLSISRKEIEQALSELGLPVSIDSTNQANDYLRNRVRNLLIPHIQESFPGYRSAILTLREKAEAASERLSEGFSELCEKALQVLHPGSVLIDKQLFIEASRWERTELLYAAWTYVRPEPDETLPYQTIQRYVTLVDPREGYAPLSQTWSGLSAQARRLMFTTRSTRCFETMTHIFWMTDVVHTVKNGYLYQVTEPFLELPTGYRVVCSAIEADEPVRVDEIRLKVEEDSSRLLIRSAQPGDRIRLVNGTKSINDLFNDWKVPAVERWKIPVIENRQGIQAVMGAHLGYRDRVTAVQKDSIWEHGGSSMISLQICKYY